MAYNEQLANRVREILAGMAHVEEKKMFSGITFMVNDKMCVSISNDRIMCRLDPALHEELKHKKSCSPVVMKGSEYKGFIYVNEEALQTKKELSYWVKLCLDYNKIAKSFRKKKSI